jgi:hypothetical protein
MVTTPRLLCMRQSVECLSMTMPYRLPLDGDLRDARRRASVHHVFERYYRCVYHIFSFQEASSRRFSLSESLFHLTSRKDAISRVMHSPMSFFETTVSILESALSSSY